MDNETKICKYCQKEIPKKAKICPFCRKKQGKKGFIVLIALVVIIIIIIFIFRPSGSSDSSKQSTSGNDGAGSTELNENLEDYESIEDTTGNTSENDYIGVLSILDIYELIEENSGESCPFTITDKARLFLTEHENLFPAKGKIKDSLIDSSIGYRQILKNESKFGDKLMYIPAAIVVQISEEDMGDGEYFTTLNVNDGELNYIIYYYGELDNIFEDSYISVIGLPLGTTMYDNTNGGQSRGVVLAGSKVEVQEY